MTPFRNASVMSLFVGVPSGSIADAAREALRKSLDVLEGVYVERRRGEVGDG
jgi:hypothetical protein